MKKIIISVFFILSFTLINAQSIDTTTINLKLKGLEKFGNQHRTGNAFLVLGIGVVTIGSIMQISSTDNLNSNNQYAVNQANRTIRTGRTLTYIGAAISTVGFVINIDSFKHIKFN